MKTRLFKLTLYISSILLVSCSEKSGIMEPQSQNLQGVFANLIKMRLVDYDSLVVENRPNASLNEKIIKGIQLGDKISGTFKPKDVVTPIYTPNGSVFNIQFSLSAKIYENYLRAYYFTLRFLLEDSSCVDVDTLMLMYKYPYPTVEIFQKIFDETGKDVNDFNLIGTDLYFITFREGLFKFNLSTRSTKKLLDLKYNYYLTGNEDFQFVVKGCVNVYRYNVQADSVDQIFEVGSSNELEIKGAEWYQGNLYLLIRQFQENKRDYLAQYDLNGQLIKKIYFNEKIYGLSHCAINNNFLYCNDVNRRIVKKFDLNLETFTEDKLLPSPNTTGIEFDSDKFYFLDPMRQMIGVMPATEIQ